MNGLVAVLLGMMPMSPGSGGDQGPALAADWSAPAEQAGRIARRYGFEVVPAREAGTARGTTYAAAVPADCASYLPVLAEMLDRLPVDFLSHAGVRRLVLCGEINHYGGPRPAIASPLEALILLDVRPATADESQQAVYDRIDFYHEAFHMIDHRLCFKPEAGAYSDPGWKSLNAPGFEYVIEGGERPINRGFEEPLPGFMTSYSRQSVNEDKADLFAYLMARPDLVARKWKRDEILARKLVRIMRDLHKEYPAMDDRFWAANSRKSREIRPRARVEAMGRGRAAPGGAGSPSP